MFLMALPVFSRIKKGRFADERGTPMPYEDAVKSAYIENRTRIDYNEAIHKDRKGNTFFTYLIRKLNNKPAKTTNPKGFEKRAIPQVVTVAEAADPGEIGGDVELVLGTGEADYLTVENNLAFDMATDETNHYTAFVRVKSKIDSETIVVEPVDPTDAIGKSAIVGVPISTKAYVTGDSFAQNSGSVSPIHNAVTVVDNVTQIHRTGYALSESSMKEDLYGPTERSEQREEKEILHAYKRESAMLFNGKKVIIKANANSSKIQRGYMQGFEYTLLQQGTSDEYDEWDYEAFLNHLALVFNPLLIDGEQTRRMCFYNQAARRKLTDLKNSKSWELIQNNEKFSKKLGVQGVDTLWTDSGVLDLYLHPIVNLKYNNLDEPYFMFFHPGYIEYKPYRTTQLKVGIQNNDVDGIKDEFITEETYIVYLPELHGVYRKAR